MACGSATGGAPTGRPAAIDARRASILAKSLSPRSTLPAAFRVVLGRIADAPDPGGLLLFDLATPDRGAAGEQRGWTEGDGWTVIVDTDSTPERLTRRIVTFREDGKGRYRRAEELHTLHLHAPADVLATLRRVGFTAQVLAGGYAGSSCPRATPAVFETRHMGG